VDTVISLIELVLYIAGILALSMAITWAVIRISPSESAKEERAARRAKAESSEA
jgi:hypothetical protein